ncbi:MAG: hypothetical protein IKH02_00765 [Prevotella sp.]|nr:hypothetical protein [Prevotella sp.]
MRKHNNHQTLCVEELARQNPMLSEAEMNDCYTYEEAVQECIQLFDEGMKQIDKEYASYKNKKG